MAKTKRVQVLMEPKDFKVLQRFARSRGTSVADLMREAARIHHLSTANVGRRSAAAQLYLGLPDVKLPSWKSLKKEIEDRRGARIP